MGVYCSFSHNLGKKEDEAMFKNKIILIARNCWNMARFFLVFITWIVSVNLRSYFSGREGARREKNNRSFFHPPMIREGAKKGS